MRFEKGQTLFAVQFTRQCDIDNNRFSMYSTPLMHDDIQPVKINFVKLSVEEHHKVYSEYADRSKEQPECDGFILKDEKGTKFTNQYPTASYGQISDIGDRRFYLKEDEADTNSKELIARLKANPGMPYEYHLLSDALGDSMRGIKDLGKIDSTHARYKQCSEKAAALVLLRDRIEKEFHEAYPEYKLMMDWEPIFKDSELIHPKVTIRREMAVEEARKLSVEEISNEFISGDGFTAVYPNGDLLCINCDTGQYIFSGKQKYVSHIVVYYGEKTYDPLNEGNDRIGFMVCEGEYFDILDITQAVTCFVKRLNNDSFGCEVKMGISLNHIASLQDIRSMLQSCPASLERKLHEKGKLEVMLENGGVFSLEKREKDEGFFIQYAEPVASFLGSDLKHLTSVYFPTSVKAIDNSHAPCDIVVDAAVAVRSFQKLLLVPSLLDRIDEQLLISAIAYDSHTFFQSALNSDVK